MAVEASHITLLNREMIYQNNVNKTELPKVPVSKKRSRDSFTYNPLFAIPNDAVVDPNQLQFLSEDILSLIYQQQMEIDCFIQQHTENMRMEIEEIQRRNSMRLATIYERVTNILKTKDDQIMKIKRINISLEEKVKSISIENQFWRELAESNEATANALRINLQQVLEQVQLQHQRDQFDIAGNDDAESHCGSNIEEDFNGRGERKVNNNVVNDESEYCKSKGDGYGRWCRKCGKEESCVLLLPCRHLCVCSMCVSTVDVCPVCKAIKCAGVLVNMS